MLKTSVKRVASAAKSNTCRNPQRIARSTFARFNSSKAGQKPFSAPSKGPNGLLMFGAGMAVTGLVYTFGVNNSKPFSAASTSTASTVKLAELQQPKYGGPEEFKKALKEITDLLGKENVDNSQEELDSHSDTYWNTHHAKPDERPKIIVFPKSTEQVSEIMKIVHKYRIPIVPFAGGTSLEGHFTPIYGGISIDFSNMAQVVAFHKEDLDIVVQPGMGWEDLDDYLSEHDLLFGPDPGPQAKIGGMVSVGCSGTNAYRYGTMRENVLGLTVVLADGTIVKTRQRPRKSSAGYNLTQFFIGGEGTLGIVTEATLKLHPRPKNQAIAMVTFDTITDAAAAASQVVQEGHMVGAIELLDGAMMKAINDADATERKWAEKPTIAFKLEKSQIPTIKDIVKHHRNKSFDFATTPSERVELWAARKAALWSTIEVAPKGTQAWTTDVAVPISRLADIITETQKDISDSGLYATIAGHVGDGNFHAILMYNPDTQRKTAEEVVHRMVKRAIDMEGTCTGEHGIGVGKKTYLSEELGPNAVDLMRKLKLSVDPLCLLNPDKVVTVNPNSTELGD